MNHNPYSPPQASPESQPPEEAVDESRPAVGERILAAFLLIGGVAGLVLAVWMGVQFIPLDWRFAGLVAAFLALFVAAGIAGMLLWRGHPKGRIWAIVLFAMQIPVLTVPGLSYEFYTGLALKFIGGDAGGTFASSIGANANFNLAPDATSLIYGVNVFALGALIYLLRARRGGRQPAAQDAAAGA